jgi:hypothetical protein
MPIYNRQGEGAINELSIDTSDVLLDPYTNNPIYQFDSKYLFNSDLSKTSTGIGVVVNTSNEFNFNIKNRLNITLDESSMGEDVFFNGVKIDILNKNKQLIKDNFISGDIESIDFTEQNNIESFGSFNKNYGIRMSIDDQTNIYDHTSEYYVYGNELYIKNVQVNDSSGIFINYDPIEYQEYKPYSLDASSSEVLVGEENALYCSKFLQTLNNKNASLNIKVVFASGKQEKLKINWGDGNEDIIFYYNGNTFVGPGVTVTNTDPQDQKFLSIDDSILINGKTYEFTKNHTYNVNSLTTYPIAIEVAESSTSEYVEMLNNEILLPNAITPNGILISTGLISGSIDFELEFFNNENYTSFNKIDIYAKKSQGISIDQNDLIGSVDVLNSNEYGKYEFSIDDERIDPFFEYWITLVPYSDLGSGYAWNIGPYSITQEIIDTRIAVDVGEFRVMGLSSYSLTDIVEGFLTGINSNILIDELPLDTGILSCEYYANIINSQKDTCSLKLVLNNNLESDNQNRRSFHVSEYSVSENCFVDFTADLESTEDGDFLNLSGKINNTFGLTPDQSLSFYTIRRTAMAYDTGVINPILFE